MTDLVKPLVLVAAAAAALVFVVASSLAYYGSWLDKREARAWQISDGACTIAIVPVQGDIVAYYGDSLYTDSSSAASVPVATSGDWAETLIREASYDPAVKGILLQVDSYGGLAAPGDQIHQALAASPLPSIAYIRDAGLSAAYLAALGADRVIASPFSLVGSIGITYSYLQNVEQNEDAGLEFIALSSGEFKDMGNPNKELTAEERSLYERDMQIYKDLFVDVVARERGLSRDAVEELADGSAMPGQLAAEKGLVDAVGDESFVQQQFAEMLGVDVTEVIFCK